MRRNQKTDVIPNRAEGPVRNLLFLGLNVARLDFDREGHGSSRAEKGPPKSTRLQPLRPRLFL